MGQRAKWVTEAADLQLRFAQTREDPRLDAEVLRRLERPAPRVLMIASGGCTVPVLAAAGAARICLVDLNPAQMHLTRLKLRLLEHCEPDERRTLLGHAPLDTTRRAELLDEHIEAIGCSLIDVAPRDVAGKRGLDYAGRYEALFREFAERLAGRRAELDRLLSVRSLDEQRAFLKRSTLLDAIDSIWDDVLRLEDLIDAFGPDATQNRRLEFSEHFRERCRVAFGSFLVRENPFLCQVLLCRPAPTGGADWLELPRARPTTKYEHRVSSVAKALEESDAGEYDLVHLSNTLDWVTPGEASQTLAAARRALGPGGRVILRQLNSRLDVQALTDFRWETEWSESLLARDRSWFYRALQVGIRH